MRHPRCMLYIYIYTHTHTHTHTIEEGFFVQVKTQLSCDVFIIMQ